jgi:hypothetical protein
MDPLPKRIEDWAKTNAFQIVSADRRRFFVGPFSLRRNVGHVYRIVVRGRNEDMGEGWLALQNSSFGNDCWEEVKWIRKPAHTVEPRAEDVVAQQVFGVSKMGPQTGKWSFGLVVALIFFGWGLASLVNGRFVVPSRGDHVIVGIPALLLSLGLISLGSSFHLAFFWGINAKPESKSSPNARAAVAFLFLGGFACMLLGLCIQLFSFLIGLAA